MKKKTGNPAARPHGTLAVDQDAADRDPIHGAALVLVATRIRKTLGLDILLRSTAHGWIATLATAPGHGRILAENATYAAVHDLLNTIEIVAHTLLPGGVRVID